MHDEVANMNKFIRHLSKLYSLQIGKGADSYVSQNLNNNPHHCTSSMFKKKKHNQSTKTEQVKISVSEIDILYIPSKEKSFVNDS